MRVEEERWLEQEDKEEGSTPKVSANHSLVTSSRTRVVLLGLLEVG